MWPFKKREPMIETPVGKLTTGQFNDAAALMRDGMKPLDAYRLAKMYGK